MLRKTTYNSSSSSRQRRLSVIITYHLVKWSYVILHYVTQSEWKLNKSSITVSTCRVHVQRTVTDF